jgi:hypothetical protein
LFPVNMYYGILIINWLIESYVQSMHLCVENWAEHTKSYGCSNHIIMILFCVSDIIHIHLPYICWMGYYTKTNWQRVNLKKYAFWEDSFSCFLLYILCLGYELIHICLPYICWMGTIAKQIDYMSICTLRRFIFWFS